MARPTNKKELQKLSRDNYSKLLAYINALPVPEQEHEFPPQTLNRNIRDVLAHLHAWHLMVLDWHKIGMAGQKPEIPAKGYSWKTTPQLNEVIQKRYSNIPLSETQSLLVHSFEQLQVIIENHTDEELFEKKRYKWTGSTSLGAYLISATSSHYDWALKLIKKSRKGR